MAETDLKLRSKNFKSVKVTAPSAGYTAGQMIASHNLVGVVVDTVDLDEETAMIYQCDKIVVPKNVATAEVFAVGDKVYFDSSEAEVTVSSTGNTLCGRATEAALGTDTEVEIDLMGNVIA